MATKFTALMVRQLSEVQVPTKEQEIGDIIVPGLYLRVKPPTVAGQAWSTAYLIRYTTARGVRKKMGIGAALRTPLDTARETARKLLGRVAQGEDPAEVKETEREAWTIKDAVAAYLASEAFQKKTPLTQAGDRYRLEQYIRPTLGTMLVSEVDVPAARRLLSKVKGQTKLNSRQRRIGGEGAARKAVRMLSALLTFALGEGKMKGPNPLVGRVLKLDGDGHRTTVITSTEEYAALLKAMDDLVTTGEIKPVHRAFFILLATTGMRRGEGQKLRWPDVDFDQRKLVVQDSKGAKLSRKAKAAPETVSLPPLAAEAMAALWAEGIDPGALVFAPTQGKKLSVNREWVLIVARAGLPADLVIHGLRHSLGTVGIMGGMSTLHVQKMLRHANASTTAGYVHLAEAVQSRLQDRASDFVMGGARPTAEIRPMKKTA